MCVCIIAHKRKPPKYWCAACEWLAGCTVHVGIFHFLSTHTVSLDVHLCFCVCVSDLKFHLSIGPFRAELHLFLELLQRRICLLDLLPLALPGSLQLALCLPLNQTHTHTSIYTQKLKYKAKEKWWQKSRQACSSQQQLQSAFKKTDNTNTNLDV